mmetsp:Transcript_15722/g.27931  ORF Transcript_15722/g.27931 Transcript_15722/m.27931 type:complete len:312 (-) Transcript_15722:3144-4079(-)
MLRGPSLHAYRRCLSLAWFLELKHKVSRCQDVALILLRPALAGESLDHEAVEIVGHRDLHLHLHGLQHDQDLALLQHIADLHGVAEQLARDHGRELQLVAWSGLARPALCGCAKGSVWVGHLHLLHLPFVEVAEHQVARTALWAGQGSWRQAEAQELHLRPARGVVGVHQELEPGPRGQGLGPAVQHVGRQEQWGEVCALSLREGEVEALLLVAQGRVTLSSAEVIWQITHAQQLGIGIQSRLQLLWHVRQQLVDLRWFCNQRLPAHQAHEHVTTDLEFATSVDPFLHGVHRLRLECGLDHDGDAQAQLVF